MQDPSETLRVGIRACRAGNWRQGFVLLSQLGQQEERHGQLPALFYGFLGQAIVRCEGRKRVGLELCRHAVELDAFQPENHLNLATVQLMLGQRRQAIRSLEAGLAIDPEHAGSLDLMRRIGIRRSPALPFLGRSHPINLWLGKLTWWMKRQREQAQARLEEELEEREIDRLS